MQVAALAVDGEPWPFWAGADEAERIQRWRRHVGWQEEWGRVDPVGRLNGSSGRAVRDQVLRPLGLELPLEHPGQRGDDWVQAHEASIAEVERIR